MGLQVCALNRNNMQKELQSHGTIEFPCAAYASRHTDAPGDAIPRHWHEEFEVIYIADGTLKLQTPGMERFLTREIWLRSMEMFFTLSSVIPWENCNPSCFPHF